MALWSSSRTVQQDLLNTGVTFFSRIFSENLGYTYACVFSSTTRFLRIESKPPSLFFVCVRTHMRICTHGVNVECVGCVCQIVPDNKNSRQKKN
jgi:hypothetical protein